jgi:hypothetical protein
MTPFAKAQAQVPMTRVQELGLVVLEQEPVLAPVEPVQVLGLVVREPELTGQAPEPAEVLA